MFIFVLNYDPNGLPVALVYFCLQQQLIRLLILFLSYNKMFVIDQFYWYYSCALIFLFLTIIPTVWQLCLHIFVLNNKLPNHIYCFCVTVKCLTLINILFCLFGLYIFVLNSYPNPQSLAIVHCWCPLIFLFSLTHLQYLNICSNDNSFPKELALVTFW